MSDSGLPLLPEDLFPAKVQKIIVDGDVCVFEVFAGQKRFVVVGPGFMGVHKERPQRSEEHAPTSLQGLLRKELLPSILSSGEVDDDKGLLSLVFVRKNLPKRVVTIEADGRAPRWLLLAPTEQGERILSCVPFPSKDGAHNPHDDGRDLRRGRLYERPRRTPAPRALSAPETRTLPAATSPRLLAARTAVKAEIARLQRLSRAVRGDLARHGDPAVYVAHGELLKTALSRVRRGMTFIDVVDFEGAEHRIALRPEKDARDNLAAIFSRAKKAQTAAVHAAPRLAAIDQRLALLVELQARLLRESVEDDTLARTEALLSAASTPAAPSRRRTVAQQGRRQPWRSFALPLADGVVVVRVGRGAKDNDALVKSARGNDLWLHARDRVGAHVVVPSSGGPVPEQLTHDAALLAAHFSQARGERHVDVQTTRVKHLRKPGAGAAPGFFLVAHEVVLSVRLDDERVQALLRTEVQAATATAVR